jgi:hypothetical protein
MDMLRTGWCSRNVHQREKRKKKPKKQKLKDLSWSNDPIGRSIQE